MNQDKKHNPNPGTNDMNQGKQKGFEKNRSGGQGNQPGRERDLAEDRGQGTRRKPESEGGIPELDEPDVEGVGNEGRDNRTDWDRDERSGDKGGM